MEIQIDRAELIQTLAATQDLVAPVVAGHGKRVAVFSSLIAEAMGYAQTELEQLMLTAELHDIGCFALSINEKEDLHSFDVVAPEKHCAVGFILLSQCSLFRDIARTVLHHHARWDATQGKDTKGRPIPMDAYIIHLADRVDILISTKYNVLEIKDRITAAIHEEEGTLFAPEVVRAFDQASARDSFWLQGVHHEYSTRRLPTTAGPLDTQQLFEMVDLLTLAIDYKSRFTSTHSSGVAATAVEMGTLAGYRDTLQLMLAGKLHDLGKLIVPNEIIDKVGPLDENERAIMESHPFYTRTILSHTKGLKEVARIASMHQEKINGEGYPYRPVPEEYDLPARIVAMSDVFTALTEERPYRGAMDMEHALKIMSRMTEELHLDPDLFDILVAHQEQLDQARRKAQEEAEERYRTFWEQTDKVLQLIR